MEGKLIKTENGYGLKDCELIAFVSSRRPEHKHHKLSLTNCQAIERGYDLDELIEEEVKLHYTLSPKAFKRGVEIGFQKALGILGDKRFTDKDLDKAIEYGHESRMPFNEDWYNEFIQSLQQTEWDVEICCYVEEDSDSDSFTSPMLTNTGNPKLDENGCLILKRK